MNEVCLARAAALTYRSREELRRAIAAGALRAYQVDRGQWRIRLADLDRWVRYAEAHRERFGRYGAVAHEAPTAA